MSPIHYRVKKPDLCPQLPGAVRVGGDEYVAPTGLVSKIEALDIHGVVEVLDWGETDV